MFISHKLTLLLVTSLAFAMAACDDSEGTPNGLAGAEAGTNNGGTNNGGTNNGGTNNGGTNNGGTNNGGTNNGGTNNGGMTMGGTNNGGMTMGGIMGGGFVPPMDDAGRCFQACLEQFACETEPAADCGAHARAALATACQQGCEGGSASAIQSAAMMGCEGASALVSAAGLTCVDESACAEVECEPGLACEQGACAPWACLPDFYDDEGNDARDAYAALEFAPLSEPALTLCVGDEDWFALDLPAGSSLRFDLAFKHDEADIDAKLFVGESESAAVVSASGNDNERLVLTPSEENRRVYLQVYVYGNAGATEDNPALSARYGLYLSTDLPAPICRTSSECTQGYLCNNAGVCVPPPPCAEDIDCPGGVCQVETGLCVQCLDDEACFNGVCDLSNNQCVNCLDDSHCAEAGEVCNSENNRCVECVSDAQCGDGTCNEDNRCLPNGCSDMYEPNEDQMSATPLSASINNLYLCGDEDWYQLTLDGQPTLVTLEFSHAEGDLELQLIDAAGEVVARRTSSTDNERLALLNRTGVHYLKVYGVGFTVNTYNLTLEVNPALALCFNNEDCPESRCNLDEAVCYPAGYCSGSYECQQSDPNSYCSENQCVSCMGDAAEPNDALEMPKPLSEFINAPLNVCGSRDFFSFSATEGEMITLNVLFSHEGGDIDARLYEPTAEGSLNSVASGLSVDDNETLEHTATITGTYVLEVYGYGSANNTYTITR